MNLTRSKLTAAALAAAGTLVGVAVAPSGAVPAGDGVKQVLASAGSDTSYFMMVAISKAYTGAANNPDADIAATIPPLVTAPFPTTYTVPADANCGAVTYNATKLPPFGSGAGITALVGDSTGCIDYARSSRARSASDPSSLEFYAFALDALTWSKFPGSLAPSTLTVDQLRKIYTCNPATGLPYITNWASVGGRPGAIKKYAPQTLSGTYGFWKSKIMGGTDVDAGCNAANKSIFVEENNGAAIAAGDKPNAIYPYSYSVWKAQTNKVIPDRRNGAILNAINRVVPSPATINESPSRFIGTRYIYNVVKKTSPTYGQTLRLVGVDSKGPGFICSGKAASIISQQGFTPLSKAPSTGVPASNCRREPKPL